MSRIEYQLEVSSFMLICLTFLFVSGEGGSSISEKGAAIANGAYNKGGELATGAYQGASYAKHAALDWLTTMTASSANKSIDK